VEAQVTPTTSPQFSIDTQTSPAIADFTGYVHSKFTARSPPHGTRGIYGSDFITVMDHPTPFPQFVRCNSLSISRAPRSIVLLALSFDPVSNKYTFALNVFAERAIQSLPPPAGSPAFPWHINITQWWHTYGDVYRSFFSRYGTGAIVSASLGGMAE
jgi:hypothetical protein